MGRTVPTFTTIIDNEIASWSKYRHALRKEDQEVFDELFCAVRHHLAENFYAMRTVPFESIMMSIVLEQQKSIVELKRKLSNLDRATEREKE